MPSPNSPDSYDSGAMPQPDGSQAPGQGLDFRTLIHVLLERLWVILLVTVVAVLLAAGYIKRAPVLYSSTATLEVQQEEKKLIQTDRGLDREDLRSLDVLQTISQELKSRSLLERVIDTNGLASDPRFVGLIKETPTRERLVTALSKMTDVRLRRGTRLIDITVVHPVPELTEKIANSIVEEYRRQNEEQHTSTSETADEVLIREAQRLKKKLQDSEEALQAYREKTGAVSLDDRQNTVVAKLKELSTRATEAKSARIKGESDYAQVASLGTNVQALLVLSVVANDPKVVEIQMTINKLDSEFANLRQRYLEKHPKYIQAVSQLQEWRRSFTNAVLQVPQTVKASLESARASEAALNDALKAQEKAAIDLNALSIQYNVLDRDVKADQAMYESVLNQMKQTTVNKEAQPTKVRVVQAAYRPELPFSPNKLNIMLLGALGGLFCGVLLALGLNSVDHSFKTVDQVEEVLQMPVLGAVPVMSEVRKSHSPMIVSDDPKSAGAEAFRTLRTALSMLGKVEDRRIFLFTSAVPQEGKTFSSLNYSACLAQQGLRTLLIDGDLRKPSVEEYFGAANGSPSVGVTDFLTGQKEFSEIVQSSKMEKLFFITAGTTAPNPAELLAQGGFPGLLQEALKHYDRVVVDSAPIHAVSDTLLMVDHVQTVCVVARAAKTPRKSIQRAIHLLRNAGAPLAGVVLNRLPRRRGGGYGYYYYSPYYDYSYHGKYAKKGVYGAK